MVLAGAGAKMDPHVRCVAHTLNLASQKAFKVDKVSEILTKVRKLVTFFHKSPKATEILREIQTQLHLPNHKLIQDVSTRWNSSLDMLERFWEQQPAVLNAMLSRKMKRGEAMVTFTENDMVIIPEIIKLKTPLKVATTLLSEEKNPTISMIPPIQAKLKKHFLPLESDLELISQMKEQFTADFLIATPISKMFSTARQHLTPASKTSPFWRTEHTTVREEPTEDVPDEDGNGSPATDETPPRKKMRWIRCLGISSLTECRQRPQGKSYRGNLKI
ncbi:hypothetical protein WMY93_002532 [Mugilogobius chulae]|uniref:Uncharacterized protein n=1 Tax=Mugilogobius chulae TaxID=88201 RepID=A0AAW0PU27_9GOBI